MPWTERQRRLLGELGVPAWLAPGWPADPAPSLADGPSPAPLPSLNSGAPPVDGAASPTPASASPPHGVVAPVDGAAPPRHGAVPPPPEQRPTQRPTVALPPHDDAHAGLARVARTGALTEPTAGPLDTLDWPALRAAVAACTACGLCQGRTQTVFGVGHPSAHWMVVGEAPGEQEDRQGEPFVGRSGQLLDSMLRALGLTRGDAEPAHQVYIANTLKCRPPGNRNPTPEELQRCEPFLVRQIALVRPRLILAMGRFAVQSLLRSTEPIGRLRGRVHQYQGVPLVVTYHPAYLLRNPQDKARAWDDLCLAAEAMEATGAISAMGATGGIAAAEALSPPASSSDAPSPAG